jgi:hypothetical protein
MVTCICVCLSPALDVVLYGAHFVGMKLAGMILIAVGFFLVMFPDNWPDYITRLLRYVHQSQFHNIFIILHSVVVSIPASCFRAGGFQAWSQTNYSLCWYNILNKTNRTCMLSSSSFIVHHSQNLLLAYAIWEYSDFMPVLQNPIPEVITIHKCHINMVLIQSSYEGVSI